MCSEVSPLVYNAILYKYKLYDKIWIFPCLYNIVSVQKLTKDLAEVNTHVSERGNADIITKTTSNFSLVLQNALYSRSDVRKHIQHTSSSLH